MAALLIVATSAFLSQLIGASLVDEPVHAPFDFDATLKKVYVCEGTSYDTHWENCTYSRASPETVLVSMDMIVAEEVPDTPDYSVEILIENRSDKGGERTPVAAITWGNVCHELSNKNNKAVQKFLKKVEGDMRCPIKKGIYRAVEVEISAEDMKPILREGLMFFTVTQIVESKPVACHVIEFEVSFD